MHLVLVSRTHYTMFYRWIQNIVKSVTQMLICNHRGWSNADGSLTNSTTCYKQSSPWSGRDIRLAIFFSADIRLTEIRRLIRVTAAAGALIWKKKKKQYFPNSQSSHTIGILNVIFFNYFTDTNLLIKL